MRAKGEKHMSETVISEYQRIGGGRKRKPQIKKRISKKTFLGLLAFKSVGLFAAMATPFYGLAPFGLAFLSIERSLGGSAVLSLVSVIIGSLLLGSWLMSVKYIIAELIYASVLFVLERGVKISVKTAMGAAAVSLLISGVAVMYWQGVTAYLVSALFAELIITVFGVWIFDVFKNVVNAYINKKNAHADASTDGESLLLNLKRSEGVSLMLVASLVLIGMKELYIGSVSVMNVVAAVVVLTAALSLNTPTAASCGVLVGLLCGIGTDYFLPLVGAFGFCGFMTGLFSRFGRGGGVAGLILANAVLVVYTNNAIEPMLKISEIFLASAVFIFVPQKIINALKSAFELNSISREAVLRMTESVRRRLRAVSKSFASMSDTLIELSDRGSKAELNDIGIMFDSIADKLCKNCRRSPICWGKEFNATYRGLFSLLEVLEKEGTLNAETVGNFLSDRCLNREKLLCELETQYDIYNVKKIWRSRAAESRELAGKQLRGVSEIMDSLAGELERREPCTSADSKTRASEKYVIETGLAAVAAGVSINSIESVRGESIKSVNEESTYSNALFAYRNNKGTDGNALLADRSSISGDSYAFFRDGNGKYVIALSDGMGTGENAARESRAAVRLFSTMLSSGFDRGLAVRLINSVLVMKSENKSFATMDICIIDLYTGALELIKTGAEPSFIRSGGTVSVVQSTSLPVGITAEAEPEFFSGKADGDAVIVMLTDGVEVKDGIREYIKACGGCETAEEIAGHILKEAVGSSINKNGNTIKDDMTVLAVKLHRK